MSMVQNNLGMNFTILMEFPTPVERGIGTPTMVTLFFMGQYFVKVISIRGTVFGFIFEVKEWRRGVGERWSQSIPKMDHQGLMTGYDELKQKNPVVKKNQRLIKYHSCKYLPYHITCESQKCRISGKGEKKKRKKTLLQSDVRD